MVIFGNFAAVIKTLNDRGAAARRKLETVRQFMADRQLASSVVQQAAMHMRAPCVRAHICTHSYAYMDTHIHDINHLPFDLMHVK